MEAIGYDEVFYGGVCVLAAKNGGAYPYGNSLLVRGSDSTLIVDPSRALGWAPPEVDVVVVSHAHEDHLAGLRLFDTPVFAHAADIAAVRSRDVLMAGYGLPPEARDAFAHTVEHGFCIEDRPDAEAFEDGHRFDLGGRTATIVHLPGHTAGHCGILIEPDGFFFVADIDLTSFGPFYGDVGSSLSDFEASIDRCAAIEAKWYGTFHQKGVIEGAAEFRSRLTAYRGVIGARDQRLLELLAEPRSIAQVAEQRIVYRQHIDEPYVATVERHTVQCHVARLVDLGYVVEEAPGTYRVRR